MNQYIITEEQINTITQNRGRDTWESDVLSILFDVRFHPYQSEREKVLDELERKINGLYTIVLPCVNKDEGSCRWVQWVSICEAMDELRRVKE